jgi:hypothetical protein
MIGSTFRNYFFKNYLADFLSQIFVAEQDSAINAPIMKDGLPSVLV